MSTGIFIRSYDKDAEFLDLCLTSYHDHGQEYDDIVIVGDGISDVQVREVAAKHGIRYAKDQSAMIPQGYIAQQYSKMLAPQHLDTDYILYVDSDCVFLRDHSPEEWFQDGKPILLWDEWDQVGQADCWKLPTEVSSALEAPYEFMRRLPLIYPKNVIEGCVEHLNGAHGSMAALFRRSRAISEFNIIGNYAWHTEHDKFTWLNGKENAKEWPIRQYWSHEDYKKAKANYEM